MRRYIIRGRKAKAYYWCSKGNDLETLSNKYRKKKNIRYGGEILIYNALFYIFKLIFIILLTLRTTYYYRSRHKPEYNILNRVVIEEGYVRVTMRV